jgi:hypothetical protein
VLRVGQEGMVGDVANGKMLNLSFGPASVQFLASEGDGNATRDPDSRHGSLAALALRVYCGTSCSRCSASLRRCSTLGGKFRNLLCDWNAGRGIGRNGTSQKSVILMGVGGNSVATFQWGPGRKGRRPCSRRRYFNCPLPTRRASAPSSHSASQVPPSCLVHRVGQGFKRSLLL